MPALWTIFGLGAFFVAAAFIATAGAPVAAATAHVVGKCGWVETDPRALANGAGVTLDVYSLASMMVSEAGTKNETAMIAVGHAAKNMAESQSISIFKLLTRAGRNKPGTHTLDRHESYGFFASQNVGPRYAATDERPTKRALELAAQVLDDEVPDPTDGCTRFDAPKAQDKWLGVIPGYEKSSEEIAEERSQHADLVKVPGITSTRFWRPKDA
jgi:hypothetical protein